MLSVSMQTEMILYRMLQGTVYIASKLYFNHIEDSQEMYSVMCFWSSFSVSWNEQGAFMPFEIYESTDIEFTEMYPDIHFCSSTHYALNPHGDYFIEDTFLTNNPEKNQYRNKSSLFHINMNSLNQQHDEFELYISSLKFEFVVMVLTVKWSHYLSKLRGVPLIVLGY